MNEKPSQALEVFDGRIMDEEPEEPGEYTFELVKCATPGCNTRTLPKTAAKPAPIGWPDGVCELCRDPEYRALVYGPGRSDAQRELISQLAAEKRKQDWEQRQPAEPPPPDPNQLKLAA